jgi:DNA-binding MarR family transcriptional regulator
MTAREDVGVEESATAAATLNFDQLDAFLGFHMRQAQGTLHRRIVAALSGLELSQKLAAVLWLIGANPGTSQIAVGGALRMDRATTMNLIDKLEARGAAVRQRSKVDRRRQELYLTPAGQAMLVEVKAIVKGLERQFAERFSSEELETLARLLRRLYR